MIKEKSKRRKFNGPPIQSQVSKDAPPGRVAAFVPPEGYRILGGFVDQISGYSILFGVIREEGLAGQLIWEPAMKFAMITVNATMKRTLSELTASVYHESSHLVDVIMDGIETKDSEFRSRCMNHIASRILNLCYVCRDQIKGVRINKSIMIHTVQGSGDFEFYGDAFYASRPIKMVNWMYDGYRSVITPSFSKVK